MNRFHPEISLHRNLTFALSDSEKMALMASGATRDMQAIPGPHDGFKLILNQSMLALLADMKAAPPLDQNDIHFLAYRPANHLCDGGLDFIR